jgi:hypothetical protein
LAEPIVAMERIIRRYVKWLAHWPIAMLREPTDAQGDDFDDTPTQETSDGLSRRRSVTDADLDDDRLRSGLVVVLGGCLLLLPMLVWGQDGATTILVAAIGAVVILPVWRSAGAAMTGPMAIIAFLELVVGPIVIGGLFSAAAILTYIGAWGSTLGFLRYATGWREPR